jgi:hypothetical protein
MEDEYEDQQPSARRDLRYEMSNRRRLSPGQRQMASDAYKMLDRVQKAKDALGHGSEPHGGAPSFVDFARQHLGNYVIAHHSPSNDARYPGANFITHKQHEAVQRRYQMLHPEAARAYFGIGKAKDALGHGSESRAPSLSGKFYVRKTRLGFVVLNARGERVSVHMQREQADQAKSHYEKVNKFQPDPPKYRTKDQSISQWTNDQLKAGTPYNEFDDPNITEHTRSNDPDTFATHGLEGNKGKDWDKDIGNSFSAVHNRIDNLRRKTAEYGRRKMDKPPAKSTATK